MTARQVAEKAMDNLTCAQMGFWYSYAFGMLMDHLTERQIEVLDKKIQEVKKL